MFFDEQYKRLRKSNFGKINKFNKRCTELNKELRSIFLKRYFNDFIDVNLQYKTNKICRIEYVELLSIDHDDNFSFLIHTLDESGEYKLFYGTASSMFRRLVWRSGSDIYNHCNMSLITYIQCNNDTPDLIILINAIELQTDNEIFIVTKKFKKSGCVLNKRIVDLYPSYSFMSNGHITGFLDDLDVEYCFLNKSKKYRASMLQKKLSKYVWRTLKKITYMFSNNIYVVEKMYNFLLQIIYKNIDKIYPHNFKFKIGVCTKYNGVYLTKLFEINKELSSILFALDCFGGNELMHLPTLTLKHVVFENTLLIKRKIMQNH